MDLIDRQAAIGAVKKRADEARDMVGSDHPFWEGLIVALGIVEGLPSAQPEIIYCKECDYGEQDEVGRWYCRNFGCQVGDDDGSGFCADAERREE